MNPVQADSYLTQNLLIAALGIGGLSYCTPRKGYGPLYLLSGGLISLFALAFLPFTGGAPRAEALRTRGNRVGLVCSVLSILASGLIMVAR